MTKRARRTPEQARALILGATQTLLAERGPSAIRLVDVAEAAGVSHALVTHYFGSVDALIEEAFREHVHAFRNRLVDALASGDPQDPRTWVDALFDTVNHPLYGRLAAWALLSGQLQSADFFPKRDRGLGRSVDAIETYLAAAGRPIARDVLEELAVLVVSALVGYVLSDGLFWQSLGHKRSKARDEAFRERLTWLVRETLGA